MADPIHTQETLALLQQEAVRAGLLDANDPPPQGGIASDAAAEAIEALLERELRVPEPDEAACRRHFAANPARFAQGGQGGERVRLRHVLFAVTPGVDVGALRQRAEACLIDLRAHQGNEGSETDARFAKAARECSNCPSGAEGGELGTLAAEDCAPEFAREIFFGHAEVGVLPRLVHSRFGLHVVQVLQREAGQVPPFEAVRAAVAQSLRQQAYITALRQYLQVLGSATPLVQ
ncbi:MAG: peptidylprolyl isomerase [Burkholderiales bacterium]|nr:peptidylprolyl isomerase [Burkholderiales bacterium]